MAVVASLDVILAASTRKFEQGMKRAKDSIRSFVKDLKSPEKMIDRLFTPGGQLTAGLSLFGNELRKAANDVSRLADVSSKLGIDPTTMKAFESAAARTGVTVSQLEMGLQRMTRRIAEAAQGTGEAQNALKELGLDAQQLATSTPDEAFKAIAGAINQIENPADRVRLAFKLFDSEGVNLVRTLGIGAEGLDEIRRELVAFGGEIDTRTINSVKDFEVQMERLKLVVSGFATETLRDLSVIMQPINALLSKTASIMNTDVSGAVDRLNNAFGGLLNPLGWIADKIQFISDGWARLTGTTQEAAQATETAATTVSEAAGQITESTEQITAAQSAYNEQVEASKQAVQDWLDSMNDQLAELEMRLAKPLTPLEQHQQDVKNINDLYDAQLISLAKRNELLGRSFEETVGKEQQEQQKRFAEQQAKRKQAAIRKELAMNEAMQDRIQERFEERANALRAAAEVSPAAMERGTSEAFSAFQAAAKGAVVEEKILAEEKKMNVILARLEKRATFLKKAELGA